jgi:2-oxoglutarate ferredoxin oxidoreductase subunit alpha
MAIDLNIVIGGAAGQGVHTITGLLARILVRQGCRVLFVQDYQSRIRGGHLFNRIRVSDQPLMSSREGIDLLVALNQETITLHIGELSPGGALIYDAGSAGELPAGLNTLALTAPSRKPPKWPSMPGPPGRSWGCSRRRSHP